MQSPNSASVIRSQPALRFTSSSPLGSKAMTAEFLGSSDAVPTFHWFLAGLRSFHPARSLPLKGVIVLAASAACPEPVEAACPEPVEAACPEPVEAACPEPVEAACPEPVEAACPEPVEAACPEPVEAACPEPVEAACPEPVEAACPEPVEAACPEPVEAACPEPVEAACPEPVEAACPEPVEAACPEPVEAACPEPVEAAAATSAAPATAATMTPIATVRTRCMVGSFPPETALTSDMARRVSAPAAHPHSARWVRRPTAQRATGSQYHLTAPPRGLQRWPRGSRHGRAASVNY